MQTLDKSLVQGTEEWFNLRKSKITATDAAVIMKRSPWKTSLQLYYEKTSDIKQQYTNPAMQRGTDLEPIARDMFTLQTGISVHPKVVVKDWTMASLDGISQCGKFIVEIKCPGKEDHSIALSGNIPKHYFPQLQHQMYVCNAEEMYYFSFDGVVGEVLTVYRDDAFIKDMLNEEKKFFDCLINKTPPEPCENDYLERDDIEWMECASKWKEINDQLQDLEKKEKEYREHLIMLAGKSNAKGSGISLCQVSRKGNVDYSKIPELNGIDLEIYRKSPSTSWRITRS